MVFNEEVKFFNLGKLFQRRFRWILDKSLEFIKFKIPELQLKPQFLSLLSKIEKKLNQVNQLRNFEWNDNCKFLNLEGVDSQELLIKNTYFNSMQSEQKDIQDKTNTNDSTQKPPSIRWKDNNNEDKQKLVTLQIPPYNEIQFKSKSLQRPGFQNTKKKDRPLVTEDIQDFTNQKQYKFQTQPMFDLKDLKTINLYKDTKELQRSKKETVQTNNEKNKLKSKQNFQSTMPSYDIKVNNFFNQTIQDKRKQETLPMVQENSKNQRRVDARENLQNLQRNYLKIYSNNNKININKPAKKKKAVETKRPRTARSEQKQPESSIYPITGYTLKACSNCIQKCLITQKEIDKIAQQIINEDFLINSFLHKILFQFQNFKNNSSPHLCHKILNYSFTSASSSKTFSTNLRISLGESLPANFFKIKEIKVCSSTPIYSIDF